MLREMTVRSGIPGALRAAANGEQCCWCDCPTERHLQQVSRIVAQGVDVSDVEECRDALRADPHDFCAGCQNKALSMWIFTDQQVTYPICERHDEVFIRDVTKRYGGRTLVVPQRIYDKDIIS
jgi:hypothetical protein